MEISKENQVLIREIVDDLGGYTGVAHKLGVTEGAVRKWECKGIPMKYWDWIINRLDVDANYIFSILC